MDTLFLALTRDEVTTFLLVISFMLSIGLIIWGVRRKRNAQKAK